MRDSIERKYTRTWLQYERQQPMYDDSINDFYRSIYKIEPLKNIEQEFLDEFHNWLTGHKLSTFAGLSKFPIRHIIQGVTHFIDDLYQRCGDIQTFENDYKYHWRLNNNIKYVTVDNLDPKRELIISMPFPFYGDVHPNMNEILDECNRLKISVHVDSAWISCIRDINFDFDHPAIKTFAISLSKSGIGGNRIGVRYAREEPEGSITLINNFKMNQESLMYVGLKFMQKFGPEYFWKKYEKKYFKVCEDFQLTPTKAIHIAMDDNRPVGVRAVMRSL